MSGKRRRLAKYAAVLPVLALLWTGCGRSGEGAPEAGGQAGSGLEAAARKTGPVLRVEGREFTNSDFAGYVRTIMAGDEKDIPPESLSRMFDRFVDEKILLESARRRDITLTGEEKANYVARLAGEQTGEGGDDSGRAEPPESFFDGLLVEKYTLRVAGDLAVGDAEIRAYYDAHKKDFLLPERVQVSQILVPSEEKAVAVLRNVVNASEADFRRVAEEESMGPEAVKGGLMGVYRPGDLPDDMARVIFALDAGKISQVVESSYGYHIFRLDKKFPPQLESEEEAAPAIRVRVLEQKIKDALAAHLEVLKSTMDWAVFPDNLFFAYQRLDG